MARPRRTRPRIAVEPLEDRTAPAFVAASSFATGPNGTAAPVPATIATGDFNFDRHQDADLAKAGTTLVSVLLGNRYRPLRAPVTSWVVENPSQVLAGDLTEDGRLDLVTANYWDGT